MTELINFFIRCTGCTFAVEDHDIEDADNAVGKLTDLQDEFTAQKPTEYPLISRLKSMSGFRAALVGFLETFIQTCHASNLLYTDLAIIENIQVWVSTMSSSSLRPFRHTATVISLTIGTQLSRIAAELTSTLATTGRQKEGEQKKKTANKERVKQLDTKLAELERKRIQVKESLFSIFDAVYAHRYRDVDPKIRLECVTAMGNWIVNYPDYFFEGTYLRYLGWVLSDLVATTRAEDIKQLTRLYKNKDNIARLRTFTERFRARLVEMAMRDSEVGIRASTVELLSLIRDTGLLEPDDIDNIGRLIFDSEVKVRNAVAGFFAENIQDMYDNALEELGGLDALPEALQEEPEEGSSEPQLVWLKLKSIVEALQSYDEADDEQSVAASQELRGGLLVVGTESRYALAAQTVCEGIKEARQWDAVAAYLLYDSSAAKDDFGERCQLNEKEQILLLETLNVSVKRKLTEPVDGENDKKGKKSHAQMEESRAAKESAAARLAKLIPELLKKFGSSPATTSTVLRLGQLLNLEVFQELREDSTTYASLLEDINKQFLTHADSGVLAEASTALLHARGFEDLEEITQGKVQDLWDGTINVLRVRMSGDQWTDNVGDICDAVRRIAHLASIMDCTAIFRSVSRASTKKTKKTAQAKQSSLFDLLMEIVKEPAFDAEAGEEAHETIIAASKALMFYYMWLVRALQAQVKAPGPNTTTSDIQFDEEAYNFLPFSSALITVAQGRHPSSDVRTAVLGTLLDLHTLFATFRHKGAILYSLVRPVDPSAVPLILTTFSNLEKSFAKKSNKRLDVSLDDDLDSAPEDFDDDDEDDDENEPGHRSHKKQAELLAEQRLCEFTGKVVLALVARVLDQPSRGEDREATATSTATGSRVIKARIERNRMKLGANFKEVIAYLDQSKDGPTAGGKKRAAAAAVAKGRGKKAQPLQRNTTAQATSGANVAGAGGKKSKPVIAPGDESDEDELMGGGGVEEGGEEDLRERELVEDRIVDPDDEEEDEEVEEGVEQATPGRSRRRVMEDEIEDEIMGD